MQILVRLACVVALVGLVAACRSENTHHASLASAEGLHEGSTVVVAGNEVGRVTSIRIAGTRADVEFEIDSDHQIALGSACARPVSVLPLPGMPAPSFVPRRLEIVPGNQSSTALAAIDECPDDTAERARQLGATLREAAAGFVQGVAEH